MKPRMNEQEVEMEGIETSKEMKIGNNPIIWQFLGDQLYTQGRAYIREYAQNARDVDPNWSLIMPSLHSPELQFIDNGPGMTKSFMMNQFCQAGFSTKRESNDASGGFGIGRLSGPQGTMFEVRCEGMIRTYALIKSKQSVPSVTLLNEQPMEEGMHTGVTVRVPIPPGEISACRADVQKFLKFFGLAALPKINYIMNERNWAIVDETATKAYGVSYPTVVEVGGYTFAVRYNDLVGSLSNFSGDDRSLLQRIFTEQQNGSYLLLRAPVGSVNVALNRESIKFDADTVKTLLDISKEVMTELAAATQREFDDIPTRWEAKVKFHQLRQNGLHGLFENVKKLLTWNGEPVADSTYTIYPAKDNIVLESYSSKRSKIDSNLLPFNIRLPKLNWGESEKTYLEVTSDYKHIVIVDNDEFVSRKLRAIFRPYDRVIFLTRPGKWDPVEGKTVYEEGEWWNKALELLDPPKSLLPPLKMSEIVPLPVPPRVRGTSTGTNVVRNKFFVTEPGDYVSFVGTEIDLDDEDVKVWLPIHQGDADSGDSDKWKNWRELATSADSFNHIKITPHGLKQLCGRDFKIIGVPRGQRSKVPDHWVHILDYVKDLVPPAREWAGIKAAMTVESFNDQNKQLLDMLVLRGAPKRVMDFHHKMNAYEIERAKMEQKSKAMDLLLTQPSLDDAVEKAKARVPNHNKMFEEMIEKSPALSVITKCNWSALNDADWKFLIASI